MSLMSFPTLSTLSRTLHEMRNALDKAYGDEWNTPTTTTFWAPRVNIRETGEEIEISADLPGVKKEDLSVGIENNMLVLRGNRQSETEAKEGIFHRVEKIHGSFERSFSLPAGLVRDKISASLKDGVLWVRIPKAEEAKPKVVLVQVED